MKVFKRSISIIRGFGATLLLVICFATSSIADLRIATTGDYAPFSYRESGKLTGIDIDLITDLRQELSKISITSQVVKTTWPTLIEDLLSDSFDIAISGISRSPERSTIAYLSLTYFVTGKTALTNCDFTHKFDVIGDLNHKNIRVIVNPGGTNESFVKNSLPDTTITVHNENLTIFKALAEGDADLMITDEVEAKLMASKYENLCFSEGKTFYRIEKVILMKKSGHLNSFINKWLERKIADGTVKRIIQAHIPSS